MIYNPLANLQWAAEAFKVIFYQDVEGHDEIKTEAGKKINTLRRALVALHFILDVFLAKAKGS